MKKLLILTIVLSIAGMLKAQNFTDLTFGTDSTFEVISWNIEWFPKNGQTTVNYAGEIMQALDADVFAIQEVDDTTLFKQMVDNLPGYDYFFKSSYFAGLAYIYKTDDIEVHNMYEIYTSQPYWSPFPRSPVVMELTYMNEDIIIINNHFKCCGDGTLNMSNTGDEEHRRLIASTLLKEYIDQNFSDKRVVMLGDLNDILTDSPSNNVFQMFIDDNSNYSFVDMNIAQSASSGWSYPSWPSHLDHMLITNELFMEFNNAHSKIEVIKLEEYFSGGWSSYDSNVSDHRPVGLKLKIQASNNSITENNAPEVIHVYPNPANISESVTIQAKTTIDTIEIYNASGMVVHQFTSNVIKDKLCTLPTNKLAPGIYFIRVISADQTSSSRKLILLG